MYLRVSFLSPTLLVLMHISEWLVHLDKLGCVPWFRHILCILGMSKLPFDVVYEESNW
jgi:hypothetical protein